MKIQKILAPKKNNPLIPRNPVDPAGQMPTVRRLFRDLKKRFTRINSEVQKLVSEQKQYQARIATNSVKYYRPLVFCTNSDGHLDTKLGELTVNKAYYEYQIDEQRYASIQDFIMRVLRNELLESYDGSKPFSWFYQSYLEQSFIDGINDQIYSAQSMADPAIVGEEISQQIMNLQEDNVSPQQQQRLGLVYSRVFNEMQGLTDSMKLDLSETLTRGMANGLGVAAISRDIKKRVQVGFSRAQRIARTEILGAYRTATRSEQKDINETIYADSEWHMALLWWSALTSTTRKWHASKHGEILTAQEVDDFYSVNGNAIQCYCSQGPVLVNKKTGETPQQDLIDKMKSQLKSWRFGMV